MPGWVQWPRQDLIPIISRSTPRLQQRSRKLQVHWLNLKESCLGVVKLLSAHLVNNSVATKMKHFPLEGVVIFPMKSRAQLAIVPQGHQVIIYLCAANMSLGRGLPREPAAHPDGEDGHYSPSCKELNQEQKDFQSQSKGIHLAGVYAAKTIRASSSLL
ncbi:hypothetical protein LXL04_039966 [Taraxacum kok-saghyz]